MVKSLRKKNKMTIEKELNKVFENISLIQTSQSEVKFPVEDLGDFADYLSDYLSDYIPNHVDWLKKGNEKLANSITQDKKIDREAISQLIVGVRNLALDFEELCDILLRLSDEIDRSSL